MWIHITRGLGGKRGIAILVITGVVGLSLILVAANWREKTLGPTGEISIHMPVEQAVALGPKARGLNPQTGYMANERGRISEPAVARTVSGQWMPVGPDVVFRVSKTDILNGETWLTGTIENGQKNPEHVLHASFLERYLPLVLDKTLELSGQRLVWVRDGPLAGQSVSGYVRNITPRPLSQCVVV